MKINLLPPLSELQKLFAIDSTSPSGLRWKITISKRTKANMIAGTQRNKDDYWRVRWTRNGKVLDYMAHRIIYALQNNCDPGKHVVDHVANDKDNTKQLRLATPLQNSQNRNGRKNTTSKYKGVSLIKRTGRWRATIRINKCFKHIGVYDTQEEAALAYNKVAFESFGEFARLNQLTSL